MKKQFCLFLLVIVLFSGGSFYSPASSAYHPAENTGILVNDKYKTEIITEDGYTYETVTNDPLKARIYTLANGLKVYMTVYKDAPRVQTYIAVRAGSKHDPADATGLAHYLEHILFKGTSKIGTSDWQKEKVYLEKIEGLYEKYRKTSDEKAREKLYAQIDSLSILASAYSIANEYDKMLSNIGAIGTNAYTFVEQTVYINDIPSNQIEKWAQIEGERFGEVVPRLFHTELEAVYEEKNKGMDTDRRKVWEAVLEGLFEKHTYGTQTTIGTIEHLKNPSITEIKKYFDKYYVPNNMAICLSGDLDPAKTIQAIDKYFGKLKPKEVPAFVPATEDPISSPKNISILGPDAENLTLAYRLNGQSTMDPNYVKIISMLLNNGQAGLIDLNLNQQQKVLSAYAYELAFNDYTILSLGGRPKEGQKLEELRDLLLAQTEAIGKGNFEDWLLKAVINDYKITMMKQYENNKSRADAFVSAFISYKTWEQCVREMEILESITKEQIVDFAKKNLRDNYVAVFKRTGQDTNVKKVPKPKISPVLLNRDKQSEFYEKVMSKESEELKPVFIDYEKDIDKFSTKSGLPVHYKKNTENGIFHLHFLWDIGKDHDPLYGMAADYFNYLGTKKYSAEALKKEFFKLGCTYGISSSGDATYVTLSGLQENFEPALKLFLDLLKNPKEDEQALKDLTGRILKSRTDSKLSKDVILRSAMVNYARHGAKNPFTNIVPAEKLKSMKAKELTSIIKALPSFSHRVLYYGPSSPSALTAALDRSHKVSKKLKPAPPEKPFPFRDIKENKVYFVDYDMVQAEIIFLSKSVIYDPALAPVVSLFNEYFGGSMGSLVFQEMRESKALAYSVRSRYEQASRKEHPNYIFSYIGTQADKINEAIEGLSELIENMPESQFLFANARTSLIEYLNTTRITKGDVLFSYERAKKMGHTYDIRKDIYKKAGTMTFEDISNFQKNYLKGQSKVILVVGSKDRIDMKALEKYGEVKELSLEEIFGY